MNKSENISELAKALSVAQSQVKSAELNAVNRYFNNSRYADLAAIWDVCREPLSKNGLCIIQGAETDEKEFVLVTTMLTHISGQWVESKLAMKPKDLSPQAVGSAITYGRRYLLASMVGVVAEDDDDGNTAQGNKTDAKKTGPAQPEQRVNKEVDTKPRTLTPEILKPEAGKKWVATEKQITRLKTIAHHSGYTADLAVEIMRKKWGVTSSTALNKEQYDEFCSYMEANPIRAQEKKDSETLEMLD